MPFAWPFRVAQIQELTLLRTLRLVFGANSTISACRAAIMRDAMWAIDSSVSVSVKESGICGCSLGLAQLLGTRSQAIREQGYAWEIHPVYKRVDTCAGEFATDTNYLSYEEECEAHPSKALRARSLFSVPNRIGQGIELDYCCVHF
jgi:carbamoyl-phosphate synthase large subunit